MDNVRISGWGCAALALMLLTLPLPWVAAAIAAAAVHEGCHYLAILALGGRVRGINVGTRGAAMEMETLRPVQEMLAAFAGPAGSLALTLAISLFPRLALCGLAQGLFNLLPIYPLDGGRILRRFLEMLLPVDTAWKITRWTGLAFAICGGLLSLRLGFLPGATVLFAVWVRGVRETAGNLASI